MLIAVNLAKNINSFLLGASVVLVARVDVVEAGVDVV